MKRRASLALFLGLFAVLTAPLFAATAPAAPADDKSPIAPIARTLTTVTGIAISPLLGTGAYGAYQYVTAKDDATRAKLPWYAQMSFWLPALVIVGACAAKDALGAALPPGWKKPLDVLETIESKATGLVAAGAVVPFTMDALSKMIVGSDKAVAAAPHFVPSGLAMVQVAAIDWSWLLNILTVPFGIAIFALVWMAGHAINALILLSPWGAIDAALKTARTAVLGLITVSAMLPPWISAILSVIVIIIAYLVAGWSFRLTVFGSIFCWDFFTFRKSRFTPAAQENRMFSGAQLVKAGVPMRSYGTLRHEPENGRTIFRYKPWLILPERKADVTTNAPSIGRGLFFSTINDGERTVLILPPRYRTHEEAIAKIYQLEGGVKPAGLLKAWSAVHELFGGAATRTQVA